MWYWSKVWYALYSTYWTLDLPTQYRIYQKKVNCENIPSHFPSVACISCSSTLTTFFCSSGAYFNTRSWHLVYICLIESSLAPVSKAKITQHLKKTRDLPTCNNKKLTILGSAKQGNISNTAFTNGLLFRIQLLLCFDVCSSRSCIWERDHFFELYVFQILYMALIFSCVWFSECWHCERNTFHFLWGWWDNNPNFLSTCWAPKIFEFRAQHLLPRCL